MSDSYEAFKKAFLEGAGGLSDEDAKAAAKEMVCKPGMSIETARALGQSYKRTRQAAKRAAELAAKVISEPEPTPEQLPPVKPRRPRSRPRKLPTPTPPTNSDETGGG